MSRNSSHAAGEAHRLVDGEVKQDDHGDVHQVVADEDGGQQTVGMLHEVKDAPCLGGVFLLHVLELCGVESEESNLAAGHEGRQEHAHQRYGDDDGPTEPAARGTERYIRGLPGHREEAEHGTIRGW